MRLIAKSEISKILSERTGNKTAEQLNSEFFIKGCFRRKFYIPMEGGKLLSMLRKIFSIARTSNWTLLIVENSGIWESWNDRNLIKMMLTAHGISEFYSDGDAFFFDAKDQKNMVSFSYIFSSFRYDFRIVDSNHEIHAMFSHDDYFFIQISENFGHHLAEFSKFTKEWPG